MNHVELVNAKYDELLQMMKTSKNVRKVLQDESKILQDENKILKATIRSIERSLRIRANHDLQWRVGAVHSQRMRGNPRNSCCC